MIRKLIFILAFIMLLFVLSFSFESGDFTVCESERNYAIYYDDQISKLIVGCCRPCSSIKIIDPITNDIEKDLSIIGDLDNVFSIYNGSYLLLLLSEIDGNLRTKEGRLIKLDYNSEQIVDELAFDNWPQDMVIQPDESFCYVVSGLMGAEKAKLHKIRLSDLEIVNTVDNQEDSNDIEITNDGLKLYSNNTKTHSVPDGTGFAGGYYLWHVNVYSSDSLFLIAYVEILLEEPRLKMGNDNRLYITNSCPLDEQDYVLYVANTLTDTIIERRTYDNIGLWQIDLSIQNNRLYMTTWLDNLWEPEYLQFVHQPSNKVMAINLSDYSYELIDMGFESLWCIAVANIDGNDRVFCTSNESAKIYYKDIE